MRIAFKINALTMSLGSLILCAALNHPAFAMEGAGSAPTLSAPAAASAAPQPAAPAPTSPLAPLPVPTGAKAAENNLNSLENKIPDSVKDVVKHLDKTTEDVTLDDLNSARQAIAKIEALIEIEKHLSELEKVRDEREKKTPFSGAIPASALQPPSGMSIASPAMINNASMPMMMSERATEVTRIMGRNGRYSAVLKMADDKTKTVQAGDSLPDGSRVVGITPTEVDLMRGKTNQILHVKNVDMVFGNS